MRRLLSPGWLALHVLAIVLVIAFLRLGWWQWERATSPTGSVRSYGYALQWPVFALFVIFMWVKMARDDLTASRTGEDASERTTPPAGAVSPYDAREPDLAQEAEEDEELAAYNRYLASLNAHASGHR
ncbi:MAG: hypothetical protein GEV03_26135 [Streptosporangiales bacterium]|nr:hypothetical protein [Streptosporangiales bacterium]